MGEAIGPRVGSCIDRRTFAIGSALGVEIMAVTALLALTEPPPQPAPPPVVVAAPEPPKKLEPSAKSRRTKGKAGNVETRTGALGAKPAAPAKEIQAGMAAMGGMGGMVAALARTPRRDAEGVPREWREASGVDTGAEVVQGVWSGVHSCAHAPDRRIVVRIAENRAWVYSHIGAASEPLSPGCLSATWSYNPERGYLEVAPQVWLWRDGQASPLRLSGFVSREYIDGEVAEVAGCGRVTLHRSAARDFPADCR